MVGIDVETRAGEHGQQYFVQCAYDLTTLEHPALGPYDDLDSARRAGDEIEVALTGASS